MTDLREAGEKSKRATHPRDGAIQQATGRDRRQQRRRAVGTVAVALLLAAAPMALLWKAFLGNQAPTDNAATPSEEAGPVEPVVVANIPVGGIPSFITVGGGSVWVAVESGSGGDSLIARIDPATNEVLETIALDQLPGQLAFEGRSLWIGLPGSVQRVNPESGQVVAEIAGPGTFVTSTPGAIWALDSADSIARIDPTTNQVAATVTLDRPADGYILSPPVGTPGAVWVMAFRDDEQAAGGSGELFRIDSITNAVVARFDLEMAGRLAVGDGAVWVVSGLTADSTTLTRIDTATNQAAEQIDVDGQWTPFAVGAGSLWLMGGMQPEILVAGLDLSNLQMGEPVVVGEMPAFEGSGIFDPEADALWISQEEDSVTRVDLVPTAATGSAANGAVAVGCGYHVCTVRPDGSGFTDLIEPLTESSSSPPTARSSRRTALGSCSVDTPKERSTAGRTTTST
jgi:hypothetical protein